MFHVKHRVCALLAAFFLTACGEDALVSHPPPVVITVPLKINQEVVCVESRLRMGFPFPFPAISYAKRIWTCDLRDRPPRV